MIDQTHDEPMVELESLETVAAPMSKAGWVGAIWAGTAGTLCIVGAFALAC